MNGKDIGPTAEPAAAAAGERVNAERERIRRALELVSLKVSLV